MDKQNNLDIERSVQLKRVNGQSEQTIFLPNGDDKGAREILEQAIQAG
jgi:hypothetical protein